MTTTDFLTEAQGRGAGDTPRRLIPSGFHRSDLLAEPRHWTGSPVRIAVLLVAVALASLAAGLMLIDWGLSG